MFTTATKNFGVWKEDKKANKISYALTFQQFLFSLSVMAFIVFLAFIVVVKIRQEFFLIESSPVELFKDKSIDHNFFIPERKAAVSIFIKKEKNNLLHIYFESGESFLIPQDSKDFISYLKKRQKNIIYMAMVLRINDEQNSRVRVWPEKNITFEDIRLIMKIFSQYGFNSFDFGVER
ncbi:MAG: hypothetical protein V4591_01200 [Bdellovibrionota bacterium]